MNELSKTKILLVDIEGTTTNISFVKDVLFPYARDNCKSFLEQHWEEQEIKEIVDDLCELSIKDGKPIDRDTDKATFIDAIIANVHSQISEDRKTKELKNLQGKIWKLAFESGTIKGHLYEDVPRNFKKWVDDGRKIFIYSSGSVEAQKLLFANSEHGNMLEFISGHFDTNVGHKQESQSYKNIVDELKGPAGNILFLSDIPNEVSAAEEAGMKVVILDRPNNPTELNSEIRKRFKIVNTFDEIEI